jgi:hypothetical protein
MSNARPLGCSVVTLIAAAVVLAGCGGGSGNGPDEWTGNSSSELACQGEGIHPEGCPITKPQPPPPPPTETYEVVGVNLQAPIASCTTPQWLDEWESGSIIGGYAVTYCATGAALTAWVASLPASFDAREVTTVPDFPAAAAGYVYVTFLAPAPTSMPCADDGGSCGAQHGEVPVDPSGNPLPCTPFYVPNLLTWVSYCAEEPSVDAWAAAYPDSTTSYAIETTAPKGYPPAAYGYTYLIISDVDLGGGGCSSTCRWY